MLFAAVNVARFLDIDPEEALSLTCRKFISRFTLVEKFAGQSGRELKSMSIEEMEALWTRAKMMEKS